jgi:dolichyl-phosphate beta-glucosyltransferase
MLDHPEKICLIIPCYNEEERLDMDQFAVGPASCLFLFVNDGSTDKTAHLIRERSDRRGFLLDLPQNVGKAEAVRTGMLHACRTPPLNEAAWIGYWDADLATPLKEVISFLRFAQFLEVQVDSVWGSRVYRLGSSIRRSYFRHLAGRLVATAAGFLLGLPSYDSQCGAKIFRREIVESAFSERFISRWLFDMELVMRLKDYHVVEYPLRQWSDIPGSQLRIVTMGLRVISDLLRIRVKYGRLKSRAGAMETSLVHPGVQRQPERAVRQV